MKVGKKGTVTITEIKGLKCKDSFGTFRNLLFLAPKGNLPGNVNLLISLRFYNAIIRSLLCFNQKYMQKN